MSHALLFWGLKFVFLMTSLAFESNWDQEARDYVLMFHNDKRKEERGCNMNKLVYDMDLEKQARQWAEHCVYKYDITEERGTNLAWDSKNLSEKDLIKFWSQRWFDEKSGKVYGLWQSSNYTQMVWASTQKVGCYSLKCENLVNVQKDAWYLVCYYTPKSNRTGGLPYTTNCTRKCKEGQLEENGLCVGEVNGALTRQLGVCRDNLNNCQDLAKQGDCERNVTYMLIECKKSCNVCIIDGVGVVELSKQSKNTGSTPELGGYFKRLVRPSRGYDDKKLTTCKDKNENCFRWALYYGCNETSYEHLNCPRSCHLCESVCQDLDPICPSKAESGQCASNPTYMKKNCEKSCKLCADKGYCDNYDLDCEKLWPNRCNDTYVERYCRKMCNTCSTEQPAYSTSSMSTITFSTSTSTDLDSP